MVKLLKKMIITILVVLGVTVTTNASYSVVVTIPIESDTSSIIIEENGIKQEVTGNELRLEYDKVGNHEYTIYADGYNEKYSLSVFVGTNKDGVLYTEVY